jgi:hypothetical protein
MPAATGSARFAAAKGSSPTVAPDDPRGALGAVGPLTRDTTPATRDPVIPCPALILPAFLGPDATARVSWRPAIREQVDVA